VPVQENIYVALFMFAVVFVVLFCLYVCVRLFSMLIGKLAASQEAQAAADKP